MFGAGLDPALRRALRQAKSKPLVDVLKLWFEANLQRISKGSKLGNAIRHGLRHWGGSSAGCERSPSLAPFRLHQVRSILRA